MEKQDTERSPLKKVFALGFISIFAYLASYYLRSLLSVATPAMLGTGEYTAEFIGLLSSVYFLVYAAGQLVNGLIGDMIRPKYMIAVGLTVTGIVITLFSLVPFAWMQVACFAFMGLGLSMLRCPIMKMVSENLDKGYSRIVCTCMSTATYGAPLIASTLAIIFKWNVMFIVAGVSTIVIALISFVFISVLEHKGHLVFHSSSGTGFRGYLEIFKIKKFGFYLLVGGVVEIAASAIGFWIPTYLSNALLLDSVTTNILFSVISVASAIAPFIALFIFRLIKERDILFLRCGFMLAIVLFLCMIIVPFVIAKIIFLVLAKLSLSCCGALLWSIYIPSMGSTGRVSSIGGVINCVGYLSASLANTVFARLLGLSWNGVILTWCAIPAIGLVAALIMKKNKKSVLSF